MEVRIHRVVQLELVMRSQDEKSASRYFLSIHVVAALPYSLDTTTVGTADEGGHVTHLAMSLTSRPNPFPSLLDSSYPMSLADQLGFRFAPPERRVWTVRALVAAVRTHVEREYTDAWVEGEISNFRAPDSGHLYFTLKDGNAQIRVVMFSSKARLLRFRPADGMQVIVRGRVTIYEDRGELQIAAEYLEPKGAGSLQVAFEQLKAKLEAEGLFAAERKKPIPALPARIGVVTSPQAAALRDILNILQRRHRAANVVIFPAQVQGDAAAFEVASGVKYFNGSRGDGERGVEVIIVARGGGSAEDLAAFNDEGLARTIAASEIPVISAVGHETDFTICDFVADLRAPTPSAAAELVIRSRVEIENAVESLRERLERAMERRLLQARHALTERAQDGAFARMMELIQRRQQKVDDLTFRIEREVRGSLEQKRRKLETVSAAVRHYDLRRVLSGIRGEMEAQTAAMAAAMRNQLLLKKLRLERMGRALETLSPLAILERGYALVFDAGGQLIKDAAQVKSGDEIAARVAKGEIRAKVSKTFLTGGTGEHGAKK
jgi:exodeoxyribonuclease VII large subunit